MVGAGKVPTEMAGIFGSNWDGECHVSEDHVKSQETVRSCDDPRKIEKRRTDPERRDEGWKINYKKI